MIHHRAWDAVLLLVVIHRCTKYLPQYIPTKDHSNLVLKKLHHPRQAVHMDPVVRQPGRLLHNLGNMLTTEESVTINGLLPFPLQCSLFGDLDF